MDLQWSWIEKNKNKGVTSVAPLLFLQLNKLLTASSSKKSNLQTHQLKSKLSKK
jgi:hypothetical protein